MTPTIDAHHHIWHRRDLPWLNGPMLQRIFGPYEPIRRDYPIDEISLRPFRLRRAADETGFPNGVTKSGYVQANWPKDRSEDEVAYCQRRFAATADIVRDPRLQENISHSRRHVADRGRHRLPLEPDHGNARDRGMERTRP
jgi:predicted TIM-barrel fold metal-dependent hydrolase